jgi:hypothetical protein
MAKHWQTISTEENDRIEGALLEYLDEDEALSALQVMIQHTVPASVYRGAEGRIRELEKALDVAADDLRSEGYYELSQRAYAPLEDKWRQA